MSVHGPLGASREWRRPGSRARCRRSPARAGRIAPGWSGSPACSSPTLLIALAAADTDVLLPESVRPVPQWLAGPFGNTGLEIGSGGLIAVLALMFLSYVVACAGRRPAVGARGADVHRRDARARSCSRRRCSLPTCSVTSSTAGWARSTARTRTWPARTRWRSTRCIPFIGAKWVLHAEAYGPVFTALSYALAPLSIAASALAFKAIAACASLGTVALVWNAARLRGLDPVKAVALVGLNPLIVIYGVGGGHNDLLMLLCRWRRRLPAAGTASRASGALLVIAAAIKLTGGSPPTVRAGQRRPARADAPTRPPDRSGVAGAALVGAVVRLFGSRPAAPVRHAAEGPERGRLAQHPRIHRHQARAADARRTWSADC